jgi:hypothetical protein
VIGFGLWGILKGVSGTVTPKTEPKSEQTLTAAQAAEQALVRYNQARFELLKGRFRPAAGGFRELYAGTELPEPMHTWSGFHEAVAELLDGRPVPAGNRFTALAQSATAGIAGMDEPTTAFFRKFTALAAGKDVVSAADAEGFNRKNYEALALLALGLKNWEAGAHAEAVALLRQFQAAEPEGSSSWVGEYRPLVAPYLEEHGLFASLVEDLSKWETNPERAESALSRIGDLKKKIRAPGLRAELRKLEEELAPKVVAAIAAAKEEEARKMAEAEGTDAQVLNAAKEKMKQLSDTYRFRDALLLIKAVNVKSEKYVAERDLLARRVEWLVQFKDQLVKDLTAGGYAGTLARKNGLALPGGVVAATETHVSIRIGAGGAWVQWHELTPASVLAMAKAFMKPTLPPEALATRQWHAGVFCIFTELYNESQILMGEAALVNEEYRLHKALFFGQPAEPAPAPKPAPVPAEDGASSAAAAPGTGLEMLTDTLNPTKRNSDEKMIKGLRRPTQ